MANLNKEQLEKVTGGSDKTSTLAIDLPLPNSTQETIEIRVYVNGALDANKTTIIDSYITHKKFNFTGTGIVEVKFKLNREVYKIYEIDFDNEIVTQIS